MVFASFPSENGYIDFALGGWNPSAEVLMCSSILKRFYLYWEAFDVLNKMRYISWVVELLES